MISGIKKSDRIRKKDASALLAMALKLGSEELKESQNETLIKDKNVLAVQPLNDIDFLRKQFTVIIPTQSGWGRLSVSFLDFLNWEGKQAGSQYPTILDPPTSTSGIRQAFDDFNDVLKKDQSIKGVAVTLVSNTSDICKLSRGKTESIEKYRKEKRELQKTYKHMCFYCGKQIDVKDSDSPIPTLLNTQCDHIFPIASALISLKRNEYLIYNFQSVHKVCNGKASAMSINQIWNEIGTDTFIRLPGISQKPWCKFNINGSLTTTEFNTQEWCRGYLSQLLSKLTIVSKEEQTIRKNIFEKIIQSYKDYKTEVKLLMEDNVSEGVGLLYLLSTGNNQNFGNPVGNIKLVSINSLNMDDDKKYEAIFLINGKQKRQKFGANGMSDYTLHKDIDRRNRYISRHLKDLDTGDPTRAGYLSMFVLWNKPSFSASVKDYKARLSVYNKIGKFPTSITGYNKSNN